MPAYEHVACEARGRTASCRADAVVPGPCPPVLLDGQACHQWARDSLGRSALRFGDAGPPTVSPVPGPTPRAAPWHRVCDGNACEPARSGACPDQFAGTACVEYR